MSLLTFHTRPHEENSPSFLVADFCQLGRKTLLSWLFSSYWDTVSQGPCSLRRLAQIEKFQNGQNYEAESKSSNYIGFICKIKNCFQFQFTVCHHQIKGTPLGGLPSSSCIGLQPLAIFLKHFFLFKQINLFYSFFL